jgi:hypothetical protein
MLSNLEIIRQVDGRHATGTKLALDGVAIHQGGSETAELVRHVGVR